MSKDVVWAKARDAAPCQKLECAPLPTVAYRAIRAVGKGVQHSAIAEMSEQRLCPPYVF